MIRVENVASLVEEVNLGRDSLRDRSIRRSCLMFVYRFSGTFGFSGRNFGFLMSCLLILRGFKDEDENVLGFVIFWGKYGNQEMRANETVWSPVFYFFILNPQVL